MLKLNKPKFLYQPVLIDETYITYIPNLIILEYYLGAICMWLSRERTVLNFQLSYFDIPNFIIWDNIRSAIYIWNFIEKKRFKFPVLPFHI